MKTIMSKIMAALIVAAALSGCASIANNQESAMQWMDHQAVNLDD